MFVHACVPQCMVICMKIKSIDDVYIGTFYFSNKHYLKEAVTISRITDVLQISKKAYTND